MLELSKKQNEVLARIVISLRVIAPLFIWVNLFIMPIIYQLLDAIDYTLLVNSGLKDKSKYQRLDKFLDFYYLTVMFIVSIYWGNILLIILFLYRLVGFILVLTTKKRIFFVFFNNTFEWMYNILSFGYVYNNDFLSSINENIYIVLLVVFIIKMIPELYIHYFNFDSLFFKLGIIKKC
jgi:hypothetical protein